MCRLFGRPTAHTGDITRARVELVWREQRQALWAMQVRRQQAQAQVVVVRRGGRHERRHSSDKQLQRR